MTTELIYVSIAIVAITVMVLAGGGIQRLIKQRKDHKMWMRLTGGQEATEL